MTTKQTRCLKPNVLLHCHVLDATNWTACLTKPLGDAQAKLPGTQKVQSMRKTWRARLWQVFDISDNECCNSLGRRKIRPWLWNSEQGSPDYSAWSVLLLAPSPFVTVFFRLFWVQTKLFFCLKMFMTALCKDRACASASGLRCTWHDTIATAPRNRCDTGWAPGDGCRRTWSGNGNGETSRKILKPCLVLSMFFPETRFQFQSFWFLNQQSETIGKKKH